MTIEFDDLIPSNSTSIEFDDLIQGDRPRWMDAADALMAATAKPAKTPGRQSVLEDAPADPASFNFRAASAVRRLLDDQTKRQAQYGTVGPVVGPKASAGTVASGLLSDLVSGGKAARAGINQMAGDVSGSQYLLDQARSEAGQADLMRAMNTPEFESPEAAGIYSGLSSTVRQLPAIAAAVATRNPNIALGGMVAPMVPEEYGKFRQRGGAPMESLAAAAGTAGTEFITEKLPMGFLVKSFGRAGAGQFLAGLLAREVPSEQAATLAQDAIDTAVANPDKTWGDYVAERPGAAYQTLLATLTQGGVMGGANAVANRFTPQPPTQPPPPPQPKEPTLADYQAAMRQTFGAQKPAPAQQPAPAQPAPDVVSRILQAIEQTQNVQDPQTGNAPVLSTESPQAPAVEAPAPAPVDATPIAGVPAEPAGPSVEAAGLTFDDLVPNNTPAASDTSAPSGVTPPVTQPAQPVMGQGAGAPRPTQAAPNPAQDLTPEQQTEIAPVLEQDFEKLYQQDIKTDIKKRLGLVKPTEQDQKKTPFKSFLREHGINPAHTSDIFGKNRFKANNILPATFRGNGMSLDDLAERAVERGFMTEADTNELISRIQSEVAGDAQVSSEFADEDAAAQYDRVQRSQIEAVAESLGLPFDNDISTDRLASMVNRISDRLKDEPRGTLKADRILKNARDAAMRIEQKRAQLEAANKAFADLSVIEQDAALDIFVDEDGVVSSFTRVSDSDAVVQWLNDNPTWGMQDETDTGTDQDTRQAQTPVAGITPEGSGRGEATGPQDEQGSAPEQGQDGLTAPTRADVLAQQARAEQAEKDKAKADKDAEAKARDERIAKEIQSRQEASADNFQLGQSAEDSLAGQGDIFSAPAEPAAKPAAEMSAAELLRAAADKMDAADKPAPIADVGEKIGGARKDTATSTGKKSKAAAPADDRPTWAKRFTIGQIAGGFDIKVNGQDVSGKWTISDQRLKDWTGQPKQMGGYFDTKEAAEAALPLIAVAQKHRVTTAREYGPDGTLPYEIWRDISDSKRVKVVDKQFATRVEAMEYMAKNAVEILETTTTFGEADLPKPESTQRIGAQRRAADVTGEDFKNEFGFRGVEFGNWNNQAERQEVMNEAYDGLMDLAEVLGVPSKAIGLNGDLALAFGARGQGLSSARAHYERDRVVMNLTKMNGAGALAHEWFHALDHYLGRQDGKASSDWIVNPDGTRSLSVKGAESDMASGGFKRANSGVREELRNAYKTLMQTIFYKAEQYVEDTAKADKFVGKTREELQKELESLRKDLSEQKDVRYYKRSNKPASAEQLAEFDAIAAELVEGRGLATEWKTLPGKSRMSIQSRHTNDALEKISELYKAVRGRAGFNADRSGVADSLRSYMSRYEQRLKMLADANSSETKTKNVPTSFAMDAKSLDQGRGTDYWTTPHEMAARAFQGYVEDMITAKNGQSPFLNYAPEDVGVLTPWGVKRPYPAGTERKAMNSAFDAFVQTIQTKDTDQGVAIYSQSGRSVPLLVKERVSPSAVEDEIEQRLAPFGHKPEIIVLDTATGVLPGASDGDGIAGSVHQGRIYLFRDQLATRFDVQKTLFHEMFHYGLRRFLTRDQFISQMKKLYERDADIKAEADRWAKTDVGRKTAAEFGAEYTTARGVDEALATLSEVNQGEFVKKDWISRSKVTVTRWLAQLAEFMGFKTYATKLRAVKSEEARQVILDVFGKLRTNAPAANNGWTDAAEPAFSTNGQQASPNRDALGRIKFRLGEVALDKLDAATRPLQERWGMRLASPELRRQLRQMKATIDEAKRKAVDVAKEMNAMPEADRAMVSDIVEKMIAPGVVPPEHAVKVADAITRTMDQQTDELVELGMLSKDSAERWRGRYLPRIYNRQTELADDPLIKRLFKMGTPTMQGIGGGSLKGRGLFQDVSVDAVEQWTGMGYEVRDPHWKLVQGKLELKDQNAPKVARDQVTVWRDWTPGERAQMGENRDALYRFVQGYTAMQRDIALGRLFNNIANNPDWVRRSASEGWVKVPDTEIPDTGGVKRYGNLAGLYVRRDVMSHLSKFEEAASDSMQLYREALGLWKEGKTALNPVAHFNNIMSNISMAHFAGVSYWDADKYVAAARDMTKDAPMLAEARKVGLFTGSFTKEEIAQAMPPELQKLMIEEEGKTRKAGRRVMNAMTFWLRKPLSDAYEFEDSFFKYLIYRDARQQGMSPDESMDYALRYIFTYDDLPSGARKVRDYAVPFFSWTYKAFPALLHTAMVYPWRFLAPAAALHSINLVAYALAAGDEDDNWLEKMAKGRELEKEEREVLPERTAGTGLLLNPKTIRLGTDSVTGHPVYLDASRVVPGGDMFDMVNQAGGLSLPAPLMPNHPILSAFAAMIANKEMFLGREVTDKNDTALEASEKRVKYMAGLVLPAVSPGGYHSQRILDATANAMDTVITTPLGEFTGVDRSGLPVQPKYAALQTLGVKARPVDLELEAGRRKAQEAAMVRSIAAEVRSMTRLHQKGAVSDAMMDRTRETAREKIERERDDE